MNDTNKFLVLLQLVGTDPALFLIKECHTDDMDQIQYLYEESRCPHDIVNADAVLLDGDTDPHGIFEPIEIVEKPGDWPFTGSVNYKRYRDLFKSLPEESTEDTMSELDNRVLSFYGMVDYFNSADDNLFALTLKMLNIDSDTMNNVTEKLIRLGFLKPSGEPVSKH